MEAPAAQSKQMHMMPDGRRLRYHLTPGSHDKPGLVWLGGFISTIYSLKGEAVAAHAAAARQSCLRFDYSAHGASSGELAEAAIGDWLEESLEMFRRHGETESVIVGSSMGGWLALLLARKLCRAPALAAGKKLKGLVLIAPALDMTDALIWQKMTPEIRAELAQNGVYMRPDAYGGPPYPIGRRLIEEGRAHLLAGRPFRTGCPVTILQGAQDDVVPWRHSLQLVDLIEEEAVNYTLVKDGDHRLSRPQDMELLLNSIEKHCRRP